jgi:hypothetical protein
LTCGRSIPGRAVPFSDVKQIRTYVDDRLAAFCYACGGAPATRDHVPPKVFLDEPYPENLPVVGSCRTCNEGASLDEEYVACVLEVAARGTVDPSGLTRPKIVRKRLDGVNGTAVEDAPSRPSSARVRPEVNARDALELDQEVSLTDWGV